MFAWLRGKVIASRFPDDVGRVFEAVEARSLYAQYAVARGVLEAVLTTALFVETMGAPERRAFLQRRLDKAVEWRRETAPPAMSGRLDPSGDPSWACASLIETWHMAHALGGRARRVGDKIERWACATLGPAEVGQIMAEARELLSRDLLRREARQAEAPSRAVAGTAIG